MMKNKNIVLKTCLTALAFSVAGLANATNGFVMSDDDMLTYSVISGGAVNIAAQPDYVTAPNVGGHLAGQAAVVVGAYTTVNDVYAGAAITTGAWSRVKHIDAGAAAGVGANAFALDVDAGAAVVVGANGQVGTITAGAAITLGAGVSHKVAEDYAGVVTRGAGSTVMTDLTDYSVIYQEWVAAGTSTGKIKTANEMEVAMAYIDTKLLPIANIDPIDVSTNTDLSNDTIAVTDGVDTFYYSAINLQANTTLTIAGNVTVITSEAMTIGAGAEIVLETGATVTWILGGSLNLGAGSTFSGETYVDGAVNGATSDVQCGNLYATGAVSVRSMGSPCLAPIVPSRTRDLLDTVVCRIWQDDDKWNEWKDTADMIQLSNNPTTEEVMMGEYYDRDPQDGVYLNFYIFDAWEGGNYIYTYLENDAEEFEQSIFQETNLIEAEACIADFNSLFGF